MKVMDMFTKEFADRYGDVDVYNDVTDESAPCFCGPILLTDAGEKKYAEALDTEIEIDCIDGYRSILCKIDGLGDKWERRWRKLNDLFEEAAGYGPWQDYNKWFITEW